VLRGNILCLSAFCDCHKQRVTVLGGSPLDQSTAKQQRLREGMFKTPLISVLCHIFVVRQRRSVLSCSMAVQPSEANVHRVGCGTPTAASPNCGSNSLITAFSLPGLQICMYIKHFMYAHLYMCRKWFLKTEVSLITLDFLFYSESICSIPTPSVGAH